PDVLDTWFSSALWPFSTLGWPDKTEDLKKFYPTSVLITGYDILTFWVSRMLTMGYKFMGKKPFSKVYIHGLVRDETGKKMSKSVGNVIDPLTTVEQYSADALRFALTSLITSGGQDIKLSDEKIQGGRNFLNKLWNVTRFTLHSIELAKDQPRKNGHSMADKWILSRCHHVVLETTKHLDNYEFGEAANLLHDFVWGEFCDWYVEMSKVGGSPSVLKFVLKTILVLLHPIVPFVTEELWHKLGEDSFIMTAEWPAGDSRMIDQELESRMAIVLEVIKSIRNIRAEMNVPVSKKAKVIFYSPTKEHLEALENCAEYIKFLARVDEITIMDKLQKLPGQVSTAVVNDIQIFLPLADLIDTDKELLRLKKELDQVRAELERIRGKLNNPTFIDKAPFEVVNNEKDKEKLLLNKQEAILKQYNGLK
ncbi:MAG: class I tRNA ligase family protein, partial [Candidatus Margulisiibacteriota bacterium]